MTEFISRKYGDEGYEVIIKTDSEKHYKASEEFARRLIDHAKPMTNADKIRSMSDRELLVFLVKHDVEQNRMRLESEWIVPTATQLSVLSNSLQGVWWNWLRQPVEVDDAENR